MEQPAGPDGPGGTGTGTMNGQTGSAASSSDHASLRYTISLRSPQCTITPFPTLGVSEATSGKGQESSRFLMIHQSNRLCRWALEQREDGSYTIAFLASAEGVDETEDLVVGLDASGLRLVPRTSTSAGRWGLHPDHEGFYSIYFVTTADGTDEYVGMTLGIVEDTWGSPTDEAKFVGVTPENSARWVLTYGEVAHAGSNTAAREQTTQPTAEEGNDPEGEDEEDLENTEDEDEDEADDDGTPGSADEEEILDEIDAVTAGDVHVSFQKCVPVQGASSQAQRSNGGRRLSHSMQGSLRR